MKVTMPYAIWRAAGESNRKKKLGGMLGFKIEIGRSVYFLSRGDICCFFVVEANKSLYF